MKSMHRKWLFALLACGLIAGCEQKLTYDRWTTIYDGASKPEVNATLGDPFETTGRSWIYHDPDRGITATIYFDKDRVTGKQWADPKRGMEGSNPNIARPGDAEKTDVQRMK